jgi:hypothetical protein
MEVNGQLHALAALPLGKEPLLPTRQEAVWGPDPADVADERKLFILFYFFKQ